jgi:hypothetical protein
LRRQNRSRAPSSLGTVKQRNEHLRLHIRPFIGEAKLSALTAPRVQQWLDELRDAGRSLSMRQKVLTNLKTIVSYAQSRGFEGSNPPGVASRPPPYGP